MRRSELSSFLAKPLPRLSVALDYCVDPIDQTLLLLFGTVQSLPLGREHPAVSQEELVHADPRRKEVFHKACQGPLPPALLETEQLSETSLRISAELRALEEPDLLRAIRRGRVHWLQHSMASEEKGNLWSTVF